MNPITVNQTKENNMNPTTITIDETEYVRKDTVTPQEAGEIRIVILQRGWVMVGYYHEEGDRAWLTNAQNIERWGTSNGLGELVNGPTDETRLRPAGRVDFHILGVVASITCEADKWTL